MSASTPVALYREPDDPSQKGHLITSFLCELLQRFSPAVWRKRHSLPMDCGHLRIQSCLSLWFYLPLGYSLFRTLTPGFFRSHRSTPGVWLLVFSLHSGPNLNATSSKKGFSDYPGQSNILSPNHSVTTAPRVTQGATEHFQFVGKNDTWILSNTDKNKNKRIWIETW